MHVNAPEFTLAITLPVVNVIEAVMNLNIDDFSTKAEAAVNELVRDLNREMCSTSPEAAVKELVRDLNTEV